MTQTGYLHSLSFHIHHDPALENFSLFSVICALYRVVNSAKRGDSRVSVLTIEAEYFKFNDLLGIRPVVCINF